MASQCTGAIPCFPFLWFLPVLPFLLAGSFVCVWLSLYMCSVCVCLCVYAYSVCVSSVYLCVVCVSVCLSVCMCVCI